MKRWLLVSIAVFAAASAPGAQAPAGRPVTFTKDVAPILQKSCQKCHRPGSIGPMSLITYEDARPWAKSIRNRVSQRQMPPWHVDRTIGIRSFKDDPSLTDEQIATMLVWIDSGMPRGSAADMPPPRVFDDSDRWHIGTP